MIKPSFFSLIGSKLYSRCKLTKKFDDYRCRILFQLTLLYILHIAHRPEKIGLFTFFIQTKHLLKKYNKKIYDIHDDKTIYLYIHGLSKPLRK